MPHRTTVARHEFPSEERRGDTMILSDVRGRGYELVFDGPNGLETCIRFEHVDVGKCAITFYRGGHRYETGSLEGGPEDYGDVGEWLADHADADQGVPA